MGKPLGKPAVLLIDAQGRRELTWAEYERWMQDEAPKCHLIIDVYEETVRKRRETHEAFGRHPLKPAQASVLTQLVEKWPEPLTVRRLQVSSRTAEKARELVEFRKGGKAERKVLEYKRGADKHRVTWAFKPAEGILWAFLDLLPDEPPHGAARLEAAPVGAEFPGTMLAPLPSQQPGLLPEDGPHERSSALVIRCVSARYLLLDDMVIVELEIEKETGGVVRLKRIDLVVGDRHFRSGPGPNILKGPLPGVPHPWLIDQSLPFEPPDAKDVSLAFRVGDRDTKELIPPDGADARLIVSLVGETREVPIRIGRQSRPG